MRKEVKRSKEIKLYKLDEAIDFIKKNSKTKFDPTLEVHLNLNFDKKKQDQNIRFTLVLPHGTGKTKKVAVLAALRIANDLVHVESALEAYTYKEQKLIDSINHALKNNGA